MKYLAYYTVFVGSDFQCKGTWPTGRIPPAPSEVYDCYYFTNNHNLFEKLKETKWIPVFLNRNHKDDTFDSNMIAKEPKACPNHFNELLDYEYLVFQDTKLEIKESIILDFIKNSLKNTMLAVKTHERTNKDTSVYGELKDSLLQGRYLLQKEQYERYIQKQIESGLLADDKCLCACGFIIRNNKHPKINEFNELWYSNILECGIQDQLSFYFVKQHYKNFILQINTPIFNSLPLQTIDPF
jgi:hypothetical protein